MWRYLFKHLPRKALYHAVYRALMECSVDLRALGIPAEDAKVFDLLRVLSNGQIHKH